MWKLLPFQVPARRGSRRSGTLKWRQERPRCPCARSANPSHGPLLSAHIRRSSRQQVSKCWTRLPNFPKSHWSIFRVMPKQSTTSSEVLESTSECSQTALEDFSGCAKAVDKTFEAMLHNSHWWSNWFTKSSERLFWESYPRKLTVVNYESRIEGVPENGFIILLHWIQGLKI